MSSIRYVEPGTQVEVSNVLFTTQPGDILGYDRFTGATTMRVWENNHHWTEICYDDEGRLYYVEEQVL